jgi:hypothetical protein
VGILLITNNDTFSRIQYITIASKGNASKFGDFFPRRAQAPAASNSWNCSGGANYTSGLRNNTIQYITIATQEMHKILEI